MEDFKNAREVVCKECEYWNLNNCCNSCPVFLVWDKKKEQKRRENLLIENACCIADIYASLVCRELVDEDKINDLDTLEQYGTFANWAREFEELFDKNQEDYLGEIEKFATEKILNEWGKDDE